MVYLGRIVEVCTVLSMRKPNPCTNASNTSVKTKNQQLDELFQTWKKEKLYNNKDFTEDGVHNEEEYERTTPKILFITKEPNHENILLDQRVQDFKAWFDLKTLVSLGTFAYHISEWSHGLINDFPLHNTITYQQRHEAISKIAFMNIKKSNGNSEAISERIMLHACTYQDNIRKQIMIIEPDLIILGLWHKFIQFPIFNEWNVEWKDTGVRKLNGNSKIYVGRYNNTKIIDFDHLTSVVDSKKSYELLQGIIESEIFKNL